MDQMIERSFEESFRSAVEHGSPCICIACSIPLVRPVRAWLLFVTFPLVRSSPFAVVFLVEHHPRWFGRTKDLVAEAAPVEWQVALCSVERSSNFDPVEHESLDH